MRIASWLSLPFAVVLVAASFLHAAEDDSKKLTSKNLMTPVGKRWAANVQRRHANFDALQAKVHAIPESAQKAPVPKELVCPIMIESAYIMATSDQAHQVDPSGLETFHFIMSGNNQFFDLV